MAWLDVVPNSDFSTILPLFGHYLVLFHLVFIEKLSLFHQVFGKPFRNICQMIWMHPNEIYQVCKKTDKYLPKQCRKVEKSEFGFTWTKKIRNFDKKQKQESKSLPKTEKTIQKIDKFLISIQIPTPKIYQKSTKKQTNICQKSAEKWRNRNSDSRLARPYVYLTTSGQPLGKHGALWRSWQHQQTTVKLRGNYN